METFRSHGKLLLTGEYVVLDGALSLAIPTKYGQQLTVKPLKNQNSILDWKSFDESKTLWFESLFELIKPNIVSATARNEVSQRLTQIINETIQLNPDFLKANQGFEIETHLDFPKNWGLGTSSTLINNIAQWANVDAYKLLENTFGGSGYDIACAKSKNPITYKIEDKKPVVETANFNPKFNNHLYFVHLNKKQNSRDGIKHYHAHKKNTASSLEDINKITQNMINCQTLESFQKLMIAHETIISKITNQTPVKNLLFKDFEGAIKSLGAWGGDFVMVASNKNPESYFKSKGYQTIIKYSKMIL